MIEISGCLLILRAFTKIMDYHEPKENNSFPIPEMLFSGDSGKPFANCMVCDKFLLNNGTPYMIEKAVRQIPAMNVKEVLFEYAMCMDCVAMMNASLSVESRQRISAYFAERVNFLKRGMGFLKNNRLDIESWTENCLIKQTPIINTAEYQIVAECDGNNLAFSCAPFALSMEAMEEMTALLSEKSLGEIDDFTGKYFTGPPEVSAILKRRLVLI
jgi:hypothetical protein